MKLYRYPQASPHNIDDGPYRNCVPLGVDGLKKHCTIVDNPDEADYFHVGQIREDSNIKLYESDGSEFEFFKDILLIWKAKEGGKSLNGSESAS